jgi:aldehyde dehydrogenase (NAD+)
MTIRELVARQRKYFRSNATRDMAFRISQLELLRRVLQENEDRLYRAIYADLKKSPFNTMVTELSLIYGEIGQALRSLPAWSRKQRVRNNMVNFPGRSYLLREPYGVTYIAGAWNYPYQLTLLPLVSSLAAGNTAVVKPSEVAPESSHAMAGLLNKHFPAEYVYVIEGGAETAQEILRERFDKIFFTGATTIGKSVYKAAARHLTPVTLELGGKNPAIVLPDADIPVAAKRILWGKFANAGQTCVAPDYLLVHESVEQELLAEMKRLLAAHFSSASIGEDYLAIVNKRHFDRLTSLMQRKQIYCGGVADRKLRFISPTILHNVSFEDIIMKEEIFGPLLPVIRFDDLREAVERIRTYDAPLSFYVFGKKSATTDSLFEEISFGGGSLNDTVMYFANRNLPHGGIGGSGMGSYHGEHGFRAFSHEKAVLEKGIWLELWFLKTLPYKKWKLKILRWLIER